MEMKDKRDFVT